MDADALESFEGRAEFVEAHPQSEKATAKPSRFMRLRGAGEATRIQMAPRSLGHSAASSSPRECNPQSADRERPERRLVGPRQTT